MICRGVYPEAESVIDWLVHNDELVCIGKSEWDKWRQICHLKRICEDTVHERIPVYIAESAVRQFNKEHGTGHTYIEILGMLMDEDDRFLFSDCNEWALFTDNRRVLILGEIDDIEDASYYAEDVRWAILWNPSHGIVIVQKSPYIEGRCPFDTEHHPPIADGLRRGNVSTFTLPPHEEASLK